MIPYGVVLKVYREFTLQEIGVRLDHICRLGMNTVVVWPSVFWWEEPTLPDYPYHTGHEILRMAHERGLKVIMETAGQIVCMEYGHESRMKDEYYPVKRDGTIDRDHGHYFFGYLNYCHPEVQQMMKEYLEGIAQAYRDSPALLGYDIWNETMFESFDNYTMAAFSNWLERKYGDIERLNDAWEETYQRFDQAGYNQLLWASVMPLVDYCAFHQDLIGEFLKEWRGYLRAIDPHHTVIADNIHAMLTSNGGFGERAQDDWTVAKNVDEMGISFYPKAGEEPMPSYLRSLTFRQIDAATGHRGYWISELQSHHQSMFMPWSFVQPWQLKQWTFEALSQGAKGLIYWKFDNFRKGLQTGGRGLVDSNGADTPRSQMAAEIAGILNADDGWGRFRPIPARVAIIFDRAAMNLIHAFTVPYAPHAPVSLYHDSIKGAYKAFFDEGIPVDILSRQDAESGEMNKYCLIILTQQINMNETFAQCLREYVQRGGVLMTDGKLAQLQENSVQYEVYPGLIRDVVGYAVSDMEPYSGEFTLTEGKLAGAHYERKTLREVTDAQIVASFSDGLPAVVRKETGNGVSLSCLTMLWLGYYQGKTGAEEIVRRLDRALNLSIFRAEDSRVKLYPIQDGERLAAVAVNESEEPVRTAILAGESRYPIAISAHDSLLWLKPEEYIE